MEKLHLVENKNLRIEINRKANFFREILKRFVIIVKRLAARRIIYLIKRETEELAR